MTAMGGVARLAALSCAASALACAGRPHTFEGDPWFQLRTEHFTVYSHASLADGEAAIRGLERIRSALLAASWHGTVSGDRTSVILLGDRAAMREFFPRGFEGIATQDPFGDPLLVVTAEQSPTEQPVLKHELAHAINRSFLLRSPRWLDEGLASYLETLKVNDDSIELGDINSERLAELDRIRTFDFGRVGS